MQQNKTGKSNIKNRNIRNENFKANNHISEMIECKRANFARN